MGTLGGIAKLSSIFKSQPLMSKSAVKPTTEKSALLSRSDSLSKSDNIAPATNQTGLIPATPEEHAAAKLIQERFRSSRVNDEMIARGEMYKKSQQELRTYPGVTKETIKDRVADPESRSSNHIAGSITHTNLMNVMDNIPIKDKRGVKRMTDEEIAFIDHAVKTDFYGTHFTKAPIVDEKGNLSLLSRQELVRKKIIFPQENSTPADIKHLGNDGNVFLAIEPGLAPQKLYSRFGDKVARIPLSNPQFTYATALTHDPLVTGPDKFDLEKCLGRLSYSDSQGFFPKEHFPSYFARPSNHVMLAHANRDAIQQEYIAAERFGKLLFEGPTKRENDQKLDALRTQLRWADRESGRRQDLIALENRELGARPLSEEQIKKVSPLMVDQSYGLFKARQLPGALAMKIVADGRELTYDGRKALLAARNPEDLNTLFNGLYRPQVQQPHSVHAKPEHFQLYDENALKALRAEYNNNQF